jgi:sigma-B regulation protein RsbU (phosphoserine phosphatase)
MGTAATNAPDRAGPVPAGFRVLVCDDQPDVCEALRLLLKSEGWQAVTVETPAALLDRVRGEAFDLVLVDLNYARDTTSGAEGMDLLASLEALGNAAPVMVMTAWSSFDLAVEAMRRGACDFIQKPWDNQRLVAAIRKQADSGRRRKSELEIAAAVQQKLFPADVPRLSTVECTARCVAAREVGGDYYDFLPAGGGREVFLLADVSGKGVPAALLMANLQAAFRSQPAEALCAPAALLAGINRHFFESTAAERFATLFYGLYDDGARRLRYVNCAHNAPFLLRQSGALERLDATALMLGAFTRWSCTVADVALAPGDALVIYSDGVTEAASASGDEFGDARLERVLRSVQGRAAAEVVDAVLAAVAAFSSGPRGDDVTVMALRAL